MALVKSGWGYRARRFWAQSYLLEGVWERTEQVCSAARMRRSLRIHCCSATWPFTKARSRGRSLTALSRDLWRRGDAHAQLSTFAHRFAVAGMSVRFILPARLWIHNDKRFEIIPTDFICFRRKITKIIVNTLFQLAQFGTYSIWFKKQNMQGLLNHYVQKYPYTRETI